MYVCLSYNKEICLIYAQEPKGEHHPRANVYISGNSQASQAIL